MDGPSPQASCPPRPALQKPGLGGGHGWVVLGGFSKGGAGSLCGPSPDQTHLFVMLGMTGFLKHETAGSFPK